DLDADLCQAVHIRLPRAEVAALDGVVEEPLDGIAVVAVVLRGVDAALCGDTVRAARGVLVAEVGDLIPGLAERGGGRRAGEPGADHDHRELATVAGVDQLGLELARIPALVDGAGWRLVVGDHGALGVQISHEPVHPKRIENGGSRNPATITTAITVANTVRWRRRA